MVGEIIAIIGLIWFLTSEILLRLYYWKKYPKSGKERALSRFTMAKLIIKNSMPNYKKLTKLI